MDLPRALAETLRRLRTETDLTPAQMARALGISRPTLARIENADQNVTLKTLGQLSRALRCTPGQLFQPGELTLRSSARRRSSS